MKTTKRKPGRPRKTTTTTGPQLSTWATTSGATALPVKKTSRFYADEINTAILDSSLANSKKLALINIVNATFNS